MNKPLVSVVILTYKKFDGLYTLLASVLQQEYPAIEIVFADDGSGCFPMEDVRSYIKHNQHDNIKHVEYIIAEQNRGTVKNINNAYHKAQGEYLFPLAGDDSFYSCTVVSQLVEFMEQEHADMLFTSRAASSNGKDVLYYLPHLQQREKLQGLSKLEQYYGILDGTCCHLVSGCVMYLKKSFYEKMGGFDESFTYMEDMAFYCRSVFNNCKISVVLDCISIYYYTEGISKQVANPRYDADRKHFETTVVMEQYDSLPSRLKRWAKYRCTKANCKSRLEQYGVFLRYPDVILKKCIQRIREKWYRRYDAKFIARMK